MNTTARPRPVRLLAVAAAGSLALTACSAGSLGSSGDGDGGGDGEESVSLSMLIDNSEQSLIPMEAVVAAFEEENPGITVDIETRPQGSEGDNVVKTRLATGDMTDVFQYNSGSLLQALDPAGNLVPLTDEPWIEDMDASFLAAVQTGDDYYGAPQSPASAGGILYNKRIYEELGLEVPLTWDEFMANNEAIAAAGIAPVIQSYQDTWTSQLFVLGDFHNVLAVDPDWAEKYTANEAKFAEEPAIEGFRHLEEVAQAGYLNEDFASLNLDGALAALAAGEGVHYPMLSFAIGPMVAAAPEAAEEVGLFAIPGDDAELNGLTVWPSAGVYIPTSTEGEKLEAAKTFLAYLASPEACDVQSEAIAPSGPYANTQCGLPDGLPTAVNDMLPYFEEGRTSPALEFLSPVKGPALEQILVEVGSGIRPAADAAALYDEDVKKQAQQLGLEGW
ncbi:extracellular solute-binding protein [Actinotalea sp. AC32]|nr:extracellular solute-binding protein [Actinotalea sp. AC32]